jgi:hypothetical protein
VAETTAPLAEHGRLAIEIGLVLLAALLALYRTRERDFWFHLAAGRSIVEHGIPTAERWCLAAYGQWPWLGEWLFHAALYVVRQLAGDVGVGLWRAGWSGLAMALALGLARLSGAGIMATALVAPLMFAVVRERLAARPEQVTVAFLLLFLFVFERARRADRDRTAWLIPIQIAWANLHPGWFLGPVVAGLHALFEGLLGCSTSRRRALRWAVLGTALYAAGAVGPRPLDTLSLRLMRDVRADPMMFTIEELRSWNWTGDHARPFTALLALALAAGLLGGRRAWRGSRPLTVAALLALAAGCASLRFQALGALVALPALATALGSPWTKAPALLPAGGRRLAAYLKAALVGLAAVAGLTWMAADAKRFPLGFAPLDDAVPVRAVALADSLGLQGPVLNTSWYGGYLLWARGEHHLPIQDTRNLGSAAFRSRFVRARLDPVALDSLLADWGFTYAVLEPPMNPIDRLAVQLFHRPDWALVFADDAGLLFVRRDRAPTFTAERAYRLMSPDYGELGAVAARTQGDPGLERALTAELERSRRESPLDARASLWLGLLALARGHAREALRWFDHVERLAPATPGVALRQGMAHELLGDREGARREYGRALRDTSDTQAARQALARLGR